MEGRGGETDGGKRGGEGDDGERGIVEFLL